MHAIVQRLLSWYWANARDLPWRRTVDPYAIWVSEIMLQQTQVKTVTAYFERWMEALPTVEALAKAKPERIHKLWEGLGYYTRVRNLQRAAQEIVDRHGGKFPAQYEEVLALPGIGRYTAGAICSIAFNQPTAILDGNVMRVLTRVWAIGGNPKDTQTNARLWSLATRLVQIGARLPPAVLISGTSGSRPARGGSSADEGVRAPVGNCSGLNQALMELGALVCTPREPGCDGCPIRGECRAHRLGRVAEFPALPRRARATPRRFAAIVFRRGNRYLVRQRPAGVVNAHLWEFPNIELTNGTNPVQAIRGIAGVKGLIPRSLGKASRPWCTIKHSITRYRITLEVWRIEEGAAQNGERAMPGKWLRAAELRRVAFSSAHRKVVERLVEMENQNGKWKIEKGKGRVAAKNGNQMTKGV